MYERVAAAGGTVQVGPREPGPGWRVHASIPVVGALV
jgi:signal transduction histidine kinase